MGLGQYQGGEGLRDVGLLHENGSAFVLGTRDLAPAGLLVVLVVEAAVRPQ